MTEAPNREWTLGKDLVTGDSLLDGLTFDDLILALRCNCQTIDRVSVQMELNRILSTQRRDMMFLLEKNMDAIIAEAKRR